MSTYSPPVQALFTLGELEWKGRSVRFWRDYRSLGLGEEHGLELGRLLGHPAVVEDDPPEEWTWTPVHAWRAAAQLRAADAVPPLVDIVRRRSDDDWVNEELPVVLGLIGPPALPALRSALPLAARDAEPWAAAAIARSLKRIASDFPETRPAVVAALSEQLALHEEQDGDLNGFLVSYLVDLQAVEAASSIEAAFEADSVSPGIVGDWENVQVALGLLAERTTPAAPVRWMGGEATWRMPRGLGGVRVDAKRARGEARARKKAVRRRKEAKKARKRRR
jgi:hypothetical protein